MGAGRAAVGHVKQQADRWWLHVDLDVLDPVAFAAQGLPGVADEPGGLSWQQLTDLLVAAVGERRLHRIEPGHLRPRTRPDGTDARRIVAMIGDVAAALP